MGEDSRTADRRRYIIRIDVIHKFMEANQGADLLVREQIRAVR